MTCSGTKYFLVSSTLLLEAKHAGQFWITRTSLTAYAAGSARGTLAYDYVSKHQALGSLCVQLMQFILTNLFYCTID